MRTFSRLAAAFLYLLLPVSASAHTCGDPATAIAIVQGSGSHSPISGQQVTVEGIITLDSRHPGGFSGFYLQQADTETDNNPATSEALFIYTRKTTGKTGDRVRVTGQVTEFHDLTELHRISRITRCGRGEIPAPLQLQWPPLRGVEAIENMLVSIKHPMVVIEHHNLLRYGEVTLAPDNQKVPTQWLPPGHEAVAVESTQSQQRLLLDDARSIKFPKNIRYLSEPLSLEHTLRAGTVTTNLTGIIDYRFGSWRLQPVSTPSFKMNPRQPAPVRDPATTLRVTSMNLENFFNGDGRGGGFPTARGARTLAEAKHQSARLAAALTATNSDIITVTELENDGTDELSALASLAHALGPGWHYIKDNNPGNDAIRGAILYRPERTQPVGPHAYPNRTQYPQSARPPLAQSFKIPGNTGSLRIVVTHFKSKSCRHAHGVNADQNDGQGCFAHRRTETARALAHWLKELPVPTGSRGTLITGDLNSYAQETPLTVLAEAGFTDLVRHFSGTDNHTFRFRGRRGTLDYSLASTALLPFVSISQVWSINADEPAALGYKTETLPALWRSSDHDPVITDLIF